MMVVIVGLQFDGKEVIVRSAFAVYRSDFAAFLLPSLAQVRIREALSRRLRYIIFWKNWISKFCT